MAAQGVIRKGMRWQVGLRNKSRVWRDKWIPRPSSYKVISPEFQNSKDALVCELINRASNEWDIDKLSQWFISEDRDTILGIPLSSSNTSDRLVWAETKNGKFIVKSACTLALEELKNLESAKCSNEVARRKLWKTIWNLNIQQKIKRFAWKESQNILASKENLAKRKITPDGVCELCGRDEDTTSHLLWLYEHAKEVWKCNKFAFPFEFLAKEKFLDVVECLQRCEHHRPGLLEQFISVCWGIWKNRNDLRMGDKGKAGRIILRNAMLLVEDYRVINAPTGFIK